MKLKERQMKLIVNENFQYNGMRRAGTTLTISAIMLKDEVAKGKHNKHWVSGLISHCSPVDNETSRLLYKITGDVAYRIEDVDVDDETDLETEIKNIRAEFDLLGKAYNPKWQLKKLQAELIRARKEVGAAPQE